MGVRMPWLRQRTERSTGLVTWSIEWREGRTIRSKPLGPVTEEQAREQLAAMKTGAPIRTPTAERALDRWLTYLRVQRLRQVTIDMNDGLLRPMVKRWDETPPPRWNRPMWEAWLAEHSWGPRSIQLRVQAARRWLAWCADNGVAVGNFLGSYKPPKVRVASQDPLAPKHVKALLSAAEGHYLEIPLYLAAYAALSRTDIRGLTWVEVDLKAREIRRLRSKTSEPLVIPVVPTLAKLLKATKPKRGAVCKGLPRSDSSLNKALHRLCDRAGVPRGGWHRLRHFIGTTLQQDGWDLVTIGALLGHAKGSTVTVRYAQTDKARVRKAAKALEKAIKKAG